MHRHKRRAFLAASAGVTLATLGFTGVGTATGTPQPIRAPARTHAPAGLPQAAAPARLLASSATARPAGNITSGTQLWLARYNGPRAYSVAASPDGTKVFVTGESGESRYDYATVAYSSSTGAQLWARRYNGSPTEDVADDSARSVAVSPDGTKVFVTGESYGVSDFDYATVAYRASTGAQLWLKRYDVPGHISDSAQSVTVSPDGTKVFVTGSSYGGAVGWDYATVAYRASTGAQLWAKLYNGRANADDAARSVAANPAGTKVFVTGYSDGAGGPSTRAYLTVAYNASTGAQLWLKRYKGSGKGSDAATSLAVSPEGRTVFVTGTSSHATDWDYATVAYRASTGARLWVKRYNGTANGTEWAASLAVSPRGTEVFVTGTSYGGVTSFGDYATVAYRASTGAQLWVRRYNGPANSWDHATALAVNPKGTRVFVTGTDYGGIQTGYDYATVAYRASTGARLWVKRYNSTAIKGANDGASSVAVSPDGTKVFVTGGSGYEYVTLAYRS